MIATLKQGPTGTDVGEYRESLQRKDSCTKNLLTVIRAVKLLQQWGKNSALFLNKLETEVEVASAAPCSTVYL